MHKMKLELGDYSGDGHQITSTRIFNSNHTVEEVRQAYKDSCKLTGVSFNENKDYTGLDRKWPETDGYRIATEYEENLIPLPAYKLLQYFGIDEAFPTFAVLAEKDGHIEIYEEEFVALFIWFLKLSLPNLILTETTADIPSINVSKEFSIGLGYGLYS